MGTAAPVYIVHIRSVYLDHVAMKMMSVCSMGTAAANLFVIILSVHNLFFRSL